MKKNMSQDLVEGTSEPRRKLTRDDRGLSTVEYIIILMLIAVAGIGLWSAFGTTVTDKITDATGAVGDL